MKALVLIDNKSNDKELNSEWGLSFFIEHNGTRVLLDCGQSDKFLKNAEYLGIDLGSVDHCVLSHGHYDHADGLPFFAEYNDHAAIYLSEAVCEDCYGSPKEEDLNGTAPKKPELTWISYKGAPRLIKYIGVARGFLRDNTDRFIRVNGIMNIAEGIYIITDPKNNSAAVDEKNDLLRKNADGSMRSDDFDHEQSLVFETEKGLVIFNSCSHAGMTDITDRVRELLPGLPVYAYVGGLHLYKWPEQEVMKLAGTIKKAGIRHIYTGHCTGDEAYAMLKRELGDIIQQFSCGARIEF